MTVRRTRSEGVSLKDGEKGPGAKGSGESLEAGKKDTASLLDPPEGNVLC